MNCPRCDTPNPEGKRYCADCGTPLTPSLVYLEEVVKAQVRESVDTRLKEQQFVEIETATAIVERVQRWAKLFGFFVAIPLGVLALALAVLGIQELRDFRRLIENAEGQIKPRIQQAKDSADAATKQADEAQREAGEARKTIEAQLSSASGATAQVQRLSTQVSALEKTTSQQMKSASDRIDKRTSDLDVKIDTATKDIAEQQRKLASTNELVKSLFSRGKTEYFDTKSSSTRFAYVPYKGGVWVYMLLADIPIRETVEIKFHVYSQPKSSYFPINSNVLFFNWGQTLEALQQQPLEVNYVPDPTQSKEKFKALSVRDRRAYADEMLLMDSSTVPEK